MKIQNSVFANLLNIIALAIMAIPTTAIKLKPSQKNLKYMTISDYKRRYRLDLKLTRSSISPSVKHQKDFIPEEQSKNLYSMDSEDNNLGYDGTSD